MSDRSEEFRKRKDAFERNTAEQRDLLVKAGVPYSKAVDQANTIMTGAAERLDRRDRERGR